MITKYNHRPAISIKRYFVSPSHPPEGSYCTPDEYVNNAGDPPFRHPCCEITRSKLLHQSNSISTDMHAVSVISPLVHICDFIFPYNENVDLLVKKSVVGKANR